MLEVGDGLGVARLPDDGRLGNHIGTHHASAILAVAEAASWAAMLGVFGERLARVLALARSAEIIYRRPGTGSITATATATATVEESPAALLDRLETSGRVEFPVLVGVANEQGKAAASVSVQWHVRRRSPVA